MAFYVAVLRWLIIYTLHTPSSCSPDFSELTMNAVGNCCPRRANRLRGKIHNFCKSLGKSQRRRAEIVKFRHLLRSTIHEPSGSTPSNKKRWLKLPTKSTPVIRRDIHFECQKLFFTRTSPPDARQIERRNFRQFLLARCLIMTYPV